MAASAAYVIAAGATEIMLTPTATVGSIGIVWLHMDRSKAMADAGLKPTLLHAGKYKVDGTQMAPLDPEAQARIHAGITDFYDIILASVGEHRPALGKIGARKTEAGIFLGQKAIDAAIAFLRRRGCFLQSE